jgi:hypothetical protein
MKKSRVIIMAVVVFIVGALCGMLSDRLVCSCIMRGNHGPNEQRIARHMNDQFTRELHLTTAQQAQLAQILDKHKQSMDALRGEIRPKFKALRESMRQEIRLILDEKQKVEFDRMVEKREKRDERDAR